MTDGDAALASPPAAGADQPRAGRMANIDGYIADSIYPSTFHPMFVAPWTDAIRDLFRK